VCWQTLASIVLVVEVVEAAAQALVPYCRAAESERAVATDGEAGGVDCACLGWAIKLKLLVGGDVAGAAGGIGEDTVLEHDVEGAVLSLLSLSVNVLVIGYWVVSSPLRADRASQKSD
jgi:hypothetical protein